MTNLLLSLFYKWGNQGTKELSNLFKVKQPVSGRAKIKLFPIMICSLPLDLFSVICPHLVLGKAKNLDQQTHWDPLTQRRKGAVARRRNESWEAKITKHTHARMRARVRMHKCSVYLSVLNTHTLIQDYTDQFLLKACQGFNFEELYKMIYDTELGSLTKV